MSLLSDSQDQGLLSHIQEFKHTTMDFKILNEMRLTGMFCDVTLVAGNVNILAHKILLVSSSPYFFALLARGFMENKSSRIPIEDVNPDILSLLVEYIYTSKIMITQNNVLDIFICSKMLQLWKVTTACAVSISENIYSQTSRKPA